jgi:multicomponent Na+:H+ antiporter subunit D
MIVGILGAVAQDDIKRMLSFTLVSHIGYMIFGAAVGTVAGISSAVFYVAHHITVQTTLFLVIGLIERYGGSTSLTRLGGLAKVAPVLAVLFFLPAMNLAGIPPFSGFLGKVGLIQAGAQQATWLTYLLIAGSVLTSLLTLYAISRVWSRAFWQAPPPEAGEPGRVPRGMTLPAAGLVAVGLSLTFLAGPLFGITDRAARDMLARDPYIDAVLPAGAP